MLCDATHKELKNGWAFLCHFVSMRVCLCVNKGPLPAGKALMSINIVMEIIQNGPKHGCMVCFMRQEREGIVREREES